MATNKSFRLKKKSLPEVKELLEGIKSGDAFSLSKGITLLESDLPEHRSIANELVSASSSATSNSLRIGITGVPGVGKSTFIESFGTLLTERDKKVAVLAIDPSSQQTGGSILGDKTRMDELSRNPNVFIRPSPSGKELGGVARATRESMILCEAAGYDVILVETVGVGQSETAVHSMVDCFLLLMLAGAGDELQGIKRGIMEMADLVVINKADGKNLDKAKLAKKYLQSALHYFPPHSAGWIIPTRIASALENQGIAEIWDECLRYEQEMTAKGYLQARRKTQNQHWFKQTLNNHVHRIVLGNSDIQQAIQLKKEEIQEGKVSPFQAADQIARLLDRLS